MQVVILAAGRGKRMKGLTRDVPKPMLRVGGKPILEHKLNNLPRKIKEVVLVVGYRGEQIMNYFKRYYNGRRIIYVYQPDFGGTGTALHLAKSILKEKFLVMMGDDLYHKKDLEELIQHEHAILGIPMDDPRGWGVIKKSRGMMKDVIENPKSTVDKLVNTGAYVLSRKFFEYDLVAKASGSDELGLPQTMVAMAKDHKIKIVKARAWHPIGEPEDLEKAEEILHLFK